MHDKTLTEMTTTFQDFVQHYTENQSNKKARKGRIATNIAVNRMSLYSGKTGVEKKNTRVVVEAKLALASRVDEGLAVEPI